MTNPKNAGRRPTPIAVLKAKGTYRKDRHENEVGNIDSLEFVGNQNLPMPYDYLNDSVKEVWIRSITEIAKVAGWVANMDLLLFEQLCVSYIECRQLYEFCKGEKRKIDNGKGIEIMNPCFKELREAQKLLKSLCSEFGFTPSSRTGIQLGQTPIEEEVKPKYKM